MREALLASKILKRQEYLIRIVKYYVFLKMSIIFCV